MVAPGITSSPQAKNNRKSACKTQERGWFRNSAGETRSRERVNAGSGVELIPKNVTVGIRAYGRTDDARLRLVRERGIRVGRIQNGGKIEELDT